MGESVRGWLPSGRKATNGHGTQAAKRELRAGRKGGVAFTEEPQTLSLGRLCCQGT